MTMTMIEQLAPGEFLSRVSRVLCNAGITTVEQLEDRLGVSPPIYSVAQDPHKRWVIRSKPYLFGENRIVAWSESEKDARLICEALTADARNGNA